LLSYSCNWKEYNDIFYSVDFSTIYNYADDNTLSYADHDLKNVISKLESDSQQMLDWFLEFFPFS
jgi:hypothetical protein